MSAEDGEARYTDSDNSDQQVLIKLLKARKEIVVKEVKLATGRTLEIHNTVRENYRQQVELIDELLELMDEGEEIVA